MCDQTLRATAQVHLREFWLKIMAAESDKDSVEEAIIFYHALPESGNTSRFVGSKERVRIGI